jgi:hypothetical protein
VRIGTGSTEESEEPMPAGALDRTAAGVDRVADFLLDEFSGELPSGVVDLVVLTARRDLDNEVPPESLAEFTHRLARRRLLDLLEGR